MVNVILCGGSGTRLWPLSRKLMPKQFAGICGQTSLFQQTVERNNLFADSFCLVSGRDYQFLAEHQMKESIKNESSVSYILEPVGRNTAPAIALACLHYSSDEIVFVTPSDHVISDIPAYEKVVKLAAEEAGKGRLVTFGIQPEKPETGYGYIEISNIDSSGTGKVKSFTEKPNITTAQEYCESGKYFWNSGMFMFKAGVFLDELKKYNLPIFNAAVKAYNASLKEKTNGSTVISIPEKDMLDIPSDSIDYAVMEKSENVYVVSSSIGWNDLGSFDSLYENGEKDSDSNCSSGDVSLIKSKGNLVIGSSRKIVLAGVEDILVMDTPDALLVCRRGKSQLVKDAVSLLQNGTEKDRDLAICHATIHRPWGTYTVLEEGKNYKIKNITVKPGKRLSLQKHSRRSEHWVVVCGTANVTVGNTEKTVNSNESTYIPIGEIHRLSNNGKIDLTIIETQVGEYLGEDDIVRIEDDFKR
jgi:mannose-1-phosphate guanylyltransferase